MNSPRSDLPAITGGAPVTREAIQARIDKLEHIWRKWTGDPGYQETVAIDIMGLRALLLLTSTQEQRCGSFPYRYIAQDLDLPYGLVLNYAEAMRGGYWGPWVAPAVVVVSELPIDTRMELISRIEAVRQ